MSNVQKEIQFTPLSPYPVSFAVIEDEVALSAFYDHLQVKDEDRKFKDDVTGAFVFGKLTPEIGLIAIYFPDKEIGISVLVHECMHVVQAVWDMIGETDIGKEAEAYLLQGIFEIAYDSIYGEEVING